MQTGPAGADTTESDRCCQGPDLIMPRARVIATLGNPAPIHRARASRAACGDVWGMVNQEAITTKNRVADLPTGERAVQCQISAPCAGFLSLGLFGRHERKFSRHFKRIF